MPDSVVGAVVGKAWPAISHVVAAFVELCVRVDSWPIDAIPAIELLVPSSSVLTAASYAALLRLVTLLLGKRRVREAKEKNGKLD